MGLYVPMWNNLQDMMLNEKSETQNDVCSMLIFVIKKVCVCVYNMCREYVYKDTKKMLTVVAD